MVLGAASAVSPFVNRKLTFVALATSPLATAAGHVGEELLNGPGGWAPIIFETQCDRCGKLTSPDYSTGAVRPSPLEHRGAWRSWHSTAFPTVAASRLSEERLECSHRSVAFEWKLA